jgi:hypothetical protein
VAAARGSRTAVERREQLGVELVGLTMTAPCSPWTSKIGRRERGGERALLGRRDRGVLGW